MSRVLRNIDVTPVLNTLDDVLTCPAGQKLEPVAFSCFADFTNPNDFIFFVHRATGAYVYFDEFKLPAGQFAHRLTWEGLALLEGDSLTVFCSTASVTTAATNLGYIEVAPV